MEKLRYVFPVFLLFILSCTTTPFGGSPAQMDYGVYNPFNEPEEDLCTLIIEQNIIVDKFNDNAVRWNRMYTEKTVKIPSGLHIFNASYADRQNISNGAVPVRGQLIKGNTYLLRATVISGQRVQYEIVIYNKQEENEESLNINRVLGNDSSMLTTYYNHIVKPTSGNTGNSVRLENNDCILIFQSGSVYTLVEKSTGQTSTGIDAFTVDASAINAKVFLYETDTAISSEEFRKSSYAGAQTILVPIRCTEKELTYRYEKPIELQGQEISFSIIQNK